MVDHIHNDVSPFKNVVSKPQYRIMEFDNPSEEKLFVINANLQRRQLNQVQKVQLCLKKKAILQETSKQHMSMSGKGVKVLTPLKRINAVIAKEAGCSAFQVHKIETVLTKAPEQLKQKVIDGRVKVNNAYNFVKQEDERNKLIVKAHSYCNRSEPGTELGIKNPNLASFKLFSGDIKEAPSHNAIKPESVSLIFTDPPYAESKLPLYKYLAKLAERVLKPGGSLITYFNQTKLPEVLEYITKNSSSLEYHRMIAVIHSGRHQDRIWSQHVIADWKVILMPPASY